MTKDTSDKSTNDGVRVYTLYLIRHGEAAHNVLEKEACRLALHEAKAAGFGVESEETQRRMEEARKAVLSDSSLLDSPLTEEGKDEARRARQVVEALEAKGLPAPTEVLVSPLQRALQTADLVFPNCDNIHVRTQLEERHTGKPCDTRDSATSISRRETFLRFSTQQLVEEDLQKLLASLDSASGGDRATPASEATVSASPYDVEHKEMLRDRTKRVFDLLVESRERVVCIVTHKGYLRELEHGHLGSPTACEFKNCEVRVYRVSIDMASGTTTPSNVERLEPSC